MMENTPPKKPDARRVWIKYRLELLGYSLARIGKEQGLDRTVAVTALRKRYPKMERVIAAKLGMRPEELWPERYPQKQTTKSKRRRQ